MARMIPLKLARTLDTPNGTLVYHRISTIYCSGTHACASLGRDPEIPRLFLPPWLSLCIHCMLLEHSRVLVSPGGHVAPCTSRHTLIVARCTGCQPLVLPHLSNFYAQNFKLPYPKAAHNSVNAHSSLKTNSWVSESSRKADDA